MGRGLALHSSIKRYIKYYELFVLCLDDHTYTSLSSFPEARLKPVKLKSLLDYFPELNQIKKDRGWSEFIFTLSPYWPLFLLKKFPDIDFITTLDADLYFFSNPKPIFDDFESYSIQITPHNFSKSNMWKEKYGKYNVSFQSFRNNSIGLQCLEKWREDCFNWCFDYFDDDKFADQKYLDEWPDIFGQDLLVINRIGAGLAPWNIGKFKIGSSFQRPYVENKNNPLIYYHFHNLRFVTERLIKTGLLEYETSEKFVVLRLIYSPYIRSIKKTKHYKLRDNNIRNHKILNSSQIRNILIHGGACLYLFRGLLIPVNFHKLYVLYKTLFNKNGTIAQS